MVTRGYAQTHVFKVDVCKGSQWVLFVATDSDAYIHKGARGIRTIINTLEFGINPIILQNLQTKSSFEEQHEEVVYASMFGIFTFICSNRLEYACRYWRYER